MDTFSSSVSTLKIPLTTNREFYHFTRTPHSTANPSRPPQPKSHFSSNLVTQKTKTFSHNNHSPSLPLKHKPSSSQVFHHKPATGYAAAIIDVAQKTNTLHSVQRDVQRLLKFLQKLKFQSDDVGVDPSLVRKVVEQRKFEGHVVALVKMLMKKNKLGIVEEVLEEFMRIYDELCGTQVVLVSSKREIGEDEMFGIAKSVQKLSGAVRVNVKNLVQEESFPSSFAV
ncbi:putative ATPase, OSCP/delta subunit, F1F0 ATP synthase OSCP/delta subunit domain-containing protein [Medicago truncatula]|uniref:ATP synthase delta chain n=1 Tax=Medicago truncatula TaxID=3880 RepID=G7L517_MEDTR|nr:ATP synthase delta chain, chloroplastic [Medicago truncatula]AES82795.1 ATP synthase delta chain [Medicago truncatula]RHN49574.1 putative ATPase, OSCP/delta subunit, F1F0 ATP synthase OSCP/delta subunit domain-containing protein [Medicago truncatula]